MGSAVLVFLSAVYAVFLASSFWVSPSYFYCHKSCHSISYSQLWPLFSYTIFSCIASEWLGWLGGLSCSTCDENYLKKKLPLSQRQVESSHRTVPTGEIPFWCCSVHTLHLHLLSLFKIFFLLPVLACKCHSGLLLRLLVFV